MKKIDNYASLKKLSLSVDALRRAMDAIISGTTPDHGKWGAFKSYARTYNKFAVDYIELSGIRNSVNTYETENMRDSVNLTWPLQKQIFDQIYADTLILSSLLSEFDIGVSASISEIQDMLVANLRKVIFQPPHREVDIQNAIEVLLVGRGYQKSVDYDRETGRVKFSGKEFVPDFVFPNYQLVLEVKLIREKTHISRSIEEMSADIPAYLSIYKSILFCIYDMGEIRDMSEIQAGIQNRDGVRVLIVKH